MLSSKHIIVQESYYESFYREFHFAKHDDDDDHNIIEHDEEYLLYDIMF